MTLHSKYSEVEKLVNANIAVLLTGEAGSGKTTLISQIADNLKLRFFSQSMTRQTTLSHLLGFMSVTGVYIPSLLKDAAENGGVYLLDELDAADANVVLSLNTIENGYLSFPTGIVKLHPDFRLVATANPQDQHQRYTGRSKLDKATLDRFDIVEIPRDDLLEKTLVDGDTFQRMNLLRRIMLENNSSMLLSMRDSMRYQKRKELDLLNGDDFVFNMVNKSELIFEKYLVELPAMPKHLNQSQCDSLDDLNDLIVQRGKQDAQARTASGSKSKQGPKPTF